MEKILIIDEDEDTAELVEIYLKNEGFEVLKLHTGKEALHCISVEKIRMVILDVMLPDIDGFSLCQKIREQYFFPIIMLTTRSDEVDKITGLMVGADDYITKPFHPLELMARVKTQLRRYIYYNKADANQEHKGEKNIRGLCISKSSHKCILNQKELLLTPIEFDILWYLCEHTGRVVSSEELFQEIWKENYMDGNNTVMMHIARLRRKMNEPSGKPKYIKTVWGVGYMIEE